MRELVDHPEQMEGHHPTTVLVTARDIIALWVARMIMSSLFFTDQIPFHDVFIYATILAKDGSRMSKSKGNGVDPMDLMNKYGADAMRFNRALRRRHEGRQARLERPHRGQPCLRH